METHPDSGHPFCQKLLSNVVNGRCVWCDTQFDKYAINLAVELLRQKLTSHGDYGPHKKEAIFRLMTRLDNSVK